MKILRYFLLGAILTLAVVLRVYQISSTPPSLSWDEVAVGYNAWSIAEYGKDEWGESYPLAFKSFGEYKMPVHIYTTALFTKVLGLSEFSTRLPSAVFGVLAIAALFFLAKLIFKNIWIALISAFFLAVSPYHLQFSRVAWETNFALFFYLCGLITFLAAIKKHRWLVLLSLIFFGISFLSYNAAKVFVPVSVSLLVFLYKEELVRLKRYLAPALVIVAAFGLLVLTNPGLAGVSRYDQVKLSEERLRQTALYQYSYSKLLGQLEIAATSYLSHLNPHYLFVSGDKNIMHSTQKVGQFYTPEVFFLLAGLGALILGTLKKDKRMTFLLGWVMLAPLPAALADPAPHASRAMFSLGSWQMISALGFYSLVTLTKKKSIRLGLAAVGLGIIGFFGYNYLNDYHRQYGLRTAEYWQYGLKEAANYAQASPQHPRVFTALYDKPYIFYLYYLKAPLPQFLETGKRQQDGWVASFDRYQFDSWEKISIIGQKGDLFVVDRGQFKDLATRYSLNLEKTIRYRDRDILYLVSIM